MEIRAIAIPMKDGKWLFNAIRIILNTEPPSSPTRADLPNVKNILIVNERWGLDRLDELLESLKNGELNIGNQTIIIKGFDGQNYRPINVYRPELATRERCNSEFGINLPSYLLKAWESTGWGSDYFTIEKINHELRNNISPWDGISDLCQNFIGLGMDQATRNDSSQFDLVAPLGIRLGSCKIEGDSVYVPFIRNEIIDPQQIGVSIITRLIDGSIIRSKYSIDHESLAKKEVSVQLPREHLRVKIILTYRGLEMDRCELGQAVNLRLSVLKGIDDDLERLAGLLKARGNDLEIGVAILFDLLGFTSTPLSQLQTDAPDILAFSDDRDWLLAVECTGREPDLNNKLTKLATRTKEIARTTEGSKVYPVLVTSMERVYFNSTDLEKATKERISVVSAEDLSRLLALASEGSAVIDVRDFLLTLIPENSGF